jgi:hypothetical protein
VPVGGLLRRYSRRRILQLLEKFDHQPIHFHRRFLFGLQGSRLARDTAAALEPLVVSLATIAAPNGLERARGARESCGAASSAIRGAVLPERDR